MNGIKRDEEDRLNNQSISIGVNDTTHFDIDKMINTKWADLFLLFFAHFFWIGKFNINDGFAQLFLNNFKFI